MRKKYPVDYGILLTVLILVSIGVDMVFSASSASAEYMYNDPYLFFEKAIVVGNIRFFCYGVYDEF